MGFLKIFAPFKKVCEEERERLFTITPNLNPFSQTLINLRKSLLFLSLRSQEERKEFVIQLYDELQAKASKSKNFTEPARDLKDIWVPLALFRACDKFWTPEMQNWFEDTIIPSLQCQYPEEDALYLLGPTNLLEERQKVLDNYGLPKCYLLSEELCERDQLSGDWQSPLKCNVGTFVKYYKTTATKYSHHEDWPSAANYYTAALDKDPDLDPLIYLQAADTNLNLKSFTLAAKYYTVAIKRGYELGPYNYGNAGYAAAKAQQDVEAADYFEKLITSEEATDNFSFLYNKGRLFPDILDIIEEVLRSKNSEVPFRQWIELRRSEYLKLQCLRRSASGLREL